MAQLEPYKGDYYLWEYVPNLGAAVVFVLIFAVLTVMHVYRLIKTRTWFCLPFAAGGIFELYGYGGRIGAHKNTASLFSYALANDGLLLAPALFAASVYMTLGRVIRALHAQKFSLLPLTWLTRAFVIGDVLSFAVQGSSVGLSVTGHTTGAKAVVLVGLFIQLLSFGIFGATAVVFYRRILAAPTPQCFIPLLPWRESLYMLFAVSGLIIVRSVFRIIEYWGGNSGYLLAHEWPVYVFDSLPMLVVMVVFYVWYPSRIWGRGVEEEVVDVEQRELSSDIAGAGFTGTEYRRVA
ncbi:putative RTA1 domain protein [Aspergillus japonicus CBS 114.51]|uniref:Putative RTA1 domain protein n=1 Tax=Aspergillus japonicus CBS 114.51 TaxID=1448312 RepID=A0A8T8XFY0_ASPJA|nr:putative RTA1 domain protein [Aspergillus japonicus CBS 114.51]RAH86192.1 putative RTA1 domain protein [Aspergillus japonicus CBS 114.51]